MFVRHRIQFLGFAALVLFVVGGCSSPWKVIRQAKEAPFTSNSEFKLMPMVYNQVQYDGDSSNASKIKADRSFMSRMFLKSLRSNAPGVRIFASKANPGTFVLRPVAQYMKPGDAKDPSVVRIRFQILKNNKRIDEIELETKVKSSEGASPSARFQMAGTKLGKTVADYLKKRVK